MLVLQMEGIMKYAVEMALGGIIYIPSFIMISSDVQISWRGYTWRQKHRQQGDHISLLLYFKNKESRLKCNKKSVSTIST
jgi:hypothetical protein